VIFNVERYALNGKTAEEDAYRLQTLRQDFFPRTAQGMRFLRIWEEQ
jgi:hypothetical protein